MTEPTLATRPNGAHTMNLLPYANHPGMTVKQFDSLNHKAHMHDLRITERVGAVVFVTSASQPGRVHRVTRSDCDCLGHAHVGRCMHRAYAIYLSDICGGFGQPAPANIVQFVHRRTPRPAA